jgi:Na+-transporting methylmalonyl-CoA/oxaloacetate decarboxylase gamma subunit
MKNLDIMLAQVGPEAPVSASSDTLGVVVVGFLFVMIVLAVLSAVTTIIGVFFIRQAARDAAKAATAAELAAAQAPAPAMIAPEDALILDDDPAMTAVIAAAVHSVIGDRAHRIVSIRSGGPGWAQEGRRQIFSSHRVR